MNRYSFPIMNRVFATLLLTLFCALTSTSIWGQKAYTIKDVPNVQVENRTYFVSDPTNIIDASTKRVINERLLALRQKTGAEVAVVVLPSIGEADCFEFAVDLFNKWGIGKASKDNGLLLLLVVDQRCIQFNTGYGLEGILPDIICKRIQMQQMVPYLKNQQWSQGMLAGVEAVNDILYDNMEDGEVINNPNQTDDAFPMIIVAIILGGGILFMALGMYIVSQRNKCPVCKKKTLQRVNSKVIVDTINYRIVENELRCTNCGNIVRRQERQEKINHRNRGGGGGPIIFGPGGGGSRGGGFGGGFGGGRTGGGGAGTRF